MFKGLFTFGNLVRAVVGGFIINQIAQGKLHGANGKFLGLIEEQEGFGLDDVAKGFIVVKGSQLVASVIKGKGAS